MGYNGVKTLSGLNDFISNGKFESLSWSGEKLFTFTDGSGTETVSFSSLLQKSKELYDTESFDGAHLTERDVQTLQDISAKLEALDSQETNLSGFDQAYLKVVSVAKSIFRCTETSVEKQALVQKISSFRASELRSSLEKPLGTQLSPQVKDALEYSYDKHYSQAFKDKHIRSREAVWDVDGTEIHRYNHGLAHTTRKVFMIPFVVDLFLRNGKDDLSKQLQVMVKEEGKDRVVEKLQIAIAFEVAGRESECGSRDDMQVYLSYLSGSSDAFLKYCEDKDLVGPGKLFKDDTDVKRYAEAIVEKYPNRFKKDRDVLPAILDMAHTLDEFRCYWPSRMKGELSEMDHHYMKNKNTRDFWELAKFCQKAVEVTGDRLMTEFSESISPRGVKFALSDAKAIGYRNFHLSNPTAFVNCSTNFQYGWNQLQKLPPPVFYSQGETTFSYLTGLRRDHFTDSQTALDRISSGDAAIRLVNTSPKNFGFEMQMINDPVFFRPTRKTRGDRGYVLGDRSAGKVCYRGYKDRTPLKDQKPKFSSPELWTPAHREGDRGLPKLTKFGRKVSLALLRPDGRVHHFKGEFPNGYFTFKPVGFLYDVNRLNQKGQRYVFDLDVGTSSKFWIGEDSHKNISNKKGREKNLSLADLKERLEREAYAGLKPHKEPFIKMQHASNEILMSPEKGAIEAVFAPEDTPEVRMRALQHAVYLHHDYGIRVPVLVIDGENPPRAYTKEELKEDLKTLSSTGFEDLIGCFFSKEEMSGLSRTQIDQMVFDKCKEYLDSQVIRDLEAQKVLEIFPRFFNTPKPVKSLDEMDAILSRCDGNPELVARRTWFENYVSIHVNPEQTLKHRAAAITA